MGEDSCRNMSSSSSVDKKSNGNFVGNGDICCSRQQHHHTTSVSSCSEADSESTTTNTCCGDTPVEDDEDNDFQYGPGIVSKLRTKFLSITMKQGRGGAGFHSTMRRSCSLENILEAKSFPEHVTNLHHQKRFVQNKKECGSSIPPWSNLKRAKSMDTLLFNVESQSNDISETDSEKDTTSSISITTNGQSKTPWREPKLIRRKDGPLNRPVLTICDEELPKPDTVKTYKRMFEPADSKKTGSMNSNVRRRPPVLRASAKSVSSTNLKSVSNGKMNGVPCNHTAPPPLPAPSPPAMTKILPPKPKVCAKEITKNHNNNNSAPKQCKNVQKNDDVEAQVRNMNMKNICDSQRMVQADVVKTASDESVQKPKENNFRRNLRALKYIEGADNPKPPIPLHKPQLKKTVPNKSHPPTSSPVVPASKIPEKMAFTKKVENNDHQDAIEPSPAKRNGVCNHSSNVSNGSPSIVEKFNSDLCRNGVNVIRNQLEEESKTTKIVQQESTTTSKSTAKTVSNIVDNDKSVDSAVFDKGVSNNGLEDVASAVMVPSSTSSEVAEKTQATLPPLALTTNSSVVMANGGEESSPSKKLVNGSSSNVPPPSGNSMVFDFRGKEVTSHVALQPAPFGCKAAIISSKKRALVMIDGKESVPYLNGCCPNGVVSCSPSANFDDEDDYFVDYSVPAPCGLVFEGENVRVGKGALLSTRNKDLKIHFDEDVEKNTFVYPSESSLLITDDSSLSDLSSLENNTTTIAATSESNGVTAPSQAVVTSPNNLLTTATKLKSVPSINTNGTNSSSLMSYTPSVLRTVDNIQPGLYRVDKDKALKKNNDINTTSSTDSEQENRNNDEDDMLKPADPDLISSWSLSANTSDLLF